MTCIVAITDGKTVTMGADSAGVGGYSLTPRKDPKIYEVGDFMFGFTSSFRMGQILGYSFSPPPVPECVDVDRYMRTSFIDAVRRALKDGGFSETQNGREHGGAFLVGFRGRVFKVESDFQVGESVFPFDACGCGEDIALGAMHSMAEHSMVAEDKIRRALSAAQAFSAGVRAPFIVVSGGA